MTQFAYDASGNVTSITDPLNNTRTFTYDSTFNKVTSITDPLGNFTTFEYDSQGKRGQATRGTRMDPGRDDERGRIFPDLRDGM